MEATKLYSGLEPVGTSGICIGRTIPFLRHFSLACLKLVPLDEKNHRCETNTARICFETCEINFTLR